MIFVYYSINCHSTVIVPTQHQYIIWTTYNTWQAYQLMYVYLARTPHNPFKSFESYRKGIGILDRTIINQSRHTKFVCRQIPLQKISDKLCMYQCISWWSSMVLWIQHHSSLSPNGVEYKLYFCIEKGHSWRIRLTIDTPYSACHSRCCLEGGPI